MVLIDIGCRIDGYPSRHDAHGLLSAPSRTISIRFIRSSTAPSSAALAAARPGVRAREVDAAARGAITAAGYGQKFLHRTGHGLGIDVHEPPYITGTSETVLQEGHVFSIEPGIYLAGRYGMRLEEIVFLGKDGRDFRGLPRTSFVSGT